VNSGSSTTNQIPHTAEQLQKILKNPLKSAPGSAIIYLYQYAPVQGLIIRAGRPIHEERTSHIYGGKGLDSHAEQNNAP
jgi:hypothetical protein